MKKLIFSLCIIILAFYTQAQNYDFNIVFEDDFSSGLINWEEQNSGSSNPNWTVNSSDQLYGYYSVYCGSTVCPQADLLLKDSLQVDDHYRASVDVLKDTSLGVTTEVRAKFSFWLDSLNKFSMYIGIAGYSPLLSEQDSIRVSIQKWQNSWQPSENWTFNFPWNIDSTNTVTIEKHGNIYSIYMNSIFLMDYVDSFLNGNGKIGFHTYGAVLIDNFILEEGTIVNESDCIEVFSDDFSSGLENWQDKYFNLSNPNWIVNSNGQLSGYYNISCGSTSCTQADLILKDSLQIADNYKASIDILKDTSLGVTVEARAKFSFWLDSLNKFSMNIGISGYLPLLSEQDSVKISVQKWQNGWLPSDSWTFYNQWNIDSTNTVSVSKNGNVYSIYLNDIFLMDYIDTFLYGSGKIGFHTYGAVLLDNFKLESCNSSSDIIVYYPFNNYANDESGNGWHGTPNGVTITDNRFGDTATAYYFDGIDDNIVSNIPNLFGGQEFTVSGWWMLDSQTINTSYWYSLFTKKDYCNHFGVMYNNGSKELHIYNNNGCISNLNINYEFIQEEWYNLTMVYKNSWLKVYINNSILDSVQLSIINESNNLVIGQQNDAGTSYNWFGKIDDIIVYNRALEESEISDIYHFGGWPINPPQTNYPDWTYTNTGNSHSILLQGSTPITIDSIPISVGDYVGVFYDSIGSSACAGYIEYTGQNIALTAWGDDSQTSEIDGFATGEELKWKIWRASDGQVFENTTATYLQPPVFPNQGVFSTNGISGLSSLEAVTIEYQYISLPQGWSFWSTYIDPFEANMDSLFISILGEVEITKDGDGNTYWPAWNINMIGDNNIGDGYQIKMLTAQTLVVEGIAVHPEQTPITVDQGWSFLGYLRQSSANIVQMLNLIVKDIEIVKDGNGMTYWPAWNINMIGNMNPGEGYQIKMNSQQILTYPTNSINISKSNILLPQSTNIHNIKKTGSNMSLMIPKTAWESKPEPGSEILVYSKSGLIVGAGLYYGVNTAITIWGDDELTSEIDGLVSGEDFFVNIITNGQEQSLKINSWVEGDGIYDNDKIAVVGKLSILNSQFLIAKLNQNTPNPFSNETEFAFYLPTQTIVEFSIFNLLGKKVETLISGEMESGKHQLLYKTKGLSPGTYYYQLKTLDFEETRKMVIMK